MDQNGTSLCKSVWDVPGLRDSSFITSSPFNPLYIWRTFESQEKEKRNQQNINFSFSNGNVPWTALWTDSVLSMLQIISFQTQNKTKQKMFLDFIYFNICVHSASRQYSSNGRRLVTVRQLQLSLSFPKVQFLHFKCSRT